jgi:hypothetical protein
MPIPTNISSNTADIYEASLTYQMMGKCGDDTAHLTQILETGDSFDSSVREVTGWKLKSLADASEIDGLEADNISALDCAKINGESWDSNLSIMADITAFDVTAGLFILYMDCPLS